MVLVLALVLAAPPEGVGVVLARRTQLSLEEASRLTSEVHAALGRLEIPVVESAELGRRLGQLLLDDATSCGGKASCLRDLTRGLGLRWLVAVSVSEIGGEQGVGVQLVDAEAEGFVASHSLLLPGKAPLDAEQLRGFAQELRARIPPVAVLEVPLLPAPVELPGSLPAPRPRTASFILGGVAVAALAVSAGFGISAGLQAPRLRAGTTTEDDPLRRSPLTGSEAQALATTITVNIIIASVAGALGLGLGTAAVLTW